VFSGREGRFFDLEDPETPLQADRAKTTLKDLSGLIVIDECQRQPEMFPLLRVLADRRPLPARFLILGSASPTLVRGISESLAGRVSHIEMGGFDIGEIGSNHHRQLWLRGGLPPAFLAEDDNASYDWRRNFIRTFLERDIPQLGIRIPAATLRRFWMMLAHYHGGVWNSADLARSMGTKEDTARRYLDVLSGAFLVRQLPPWFENTGKRLVKAPKVYIRDTGILHSLLGLRNDEDLTSHPKVGLSWEGFAIEQVVAMADAEGSAFFYKTHGGAELDLMIVKDGNRHGFEFKYQDRPRSTKSMHAVLNDLGLERLWVVYPGEQTYSLSEETVVVPLSELRGRLNDAGLRP
jgi:predicted AAA+ superfamily ATPase